MSSQDQEALMETSLVHLIERVIALFTVIVVVFLLIAIALTVAYLVLPLYGVADEAQAAIHFQMGEIYGQLGPILNGIWNFLRPVLQLVIVVVLLRWLLISPRRKASDQLGKLVADVPSLLAILVIGTFCLLPLLSAIIPSALSNVALVIVGFYFGQERLKMRREKGPEEEPEQEEDMPQRQSVEEVAPEEQS